MALFSTALIALLCVVLSLRQSPDQKYLTPESGGASAGQAVNGVAVVASQADVLWESPIVLSGAVLPRGEHHIQSGVMHLELFSGVQLVIEGETEFTIDSPMAVKIVGMGHGVLFILFFVALVMAMNKYKWKFLGFQLFVYSLIPFGFILIEKIIMKAPPKKLK